MAAGWPWQESSVDALRAHDVIGYLPDKIATMNELWRVLRDGAVAEISLLSTDGPGAFADPRLVSYWNRRSFEWFEDGHPERERSAVRYGIRARFRIAAERMETTPHGPRLTIELQAVKTAMKERR